MARRFEERVRAVEEAVADPGTPEHRALLGKTLDGKQGYLISRAAAALALDDELVPPACDAFARLLEDPIKRDPQCHGKTAIATALYDAEIRAEEVFIAGVAHVQLEPVLGGKQDTAAELRGVCLMALTHAQHPRALVHAAAMLADPERAARLAALRALDASGRPEVAEPLLRLRLEQGDDDGEVLTDCMAGLLRLDAAANLRLLSERIDGADAAAADAAALAIGSSRAPQALEVLQGHATRSVDPGRRRTLLLAMAMLRSDAAWQHLIEVIMDGERGEAVDAIDALATFGEQSDLHARVEAAVLDRGEPEVSARFERAFG